MVHERATVRVTGRVHPDLKKLIQRVQRRYPRLTEGQQVARAVEEYAPALRALLEKK